MSRITLVSLLAMFLAGGCLYVPGGRTALGVVSTTTPPNFRSLDRRVTVEECSSPLDLDDVREAAANAIARVPEANALADITLEKRETMDGGMCVQVSGTAGVLE